METVIQARAGAGLAPPSGLTYEEFLQWADDGMRAEWIDGEIVVMSPASSSHQRLSQFLAMTLRAFVDFHKAGVILTASFQMRTGPDLPGREPDIVFVTASNETRIRDNHLAGPADIAIEIISPESRTRDSIDKLREYERGGVHEYWLIDPQRQEAAFFSLEDGKFVRLDADGGTFQSRVLEGFSLRLDWLWARPLPSFWDIQKALGIGGGD